MADAGETVTALRNREATDGDFDAIIKMIDRGRLNEVFQELVDAVID